jgi:hypothetical protein
LFEFNRLEMKKTKKKNIIERLSAQQPKSAAQAQITGSSY